MGELKLAGNAVAEATRGVTKGWLLAALEITGTSFVWEPNALCSPRTGSPRAPDAHGTGPGRHVTVTRGRNSRNSVLLWIPGCSVWLWAVLGAHWEHTVSEKLKCRCWP